jgi:hypothetical protein
MQCGVRIIRPIRAFDSISLFWPRRFVAIVCAMLTFGFFGFCGVAVGFWLESRDYRGVELEFQELFDTLDQLGLILAYQ